MRAHKCIKGGNCDCPWQWPGHACPLNVNGRLVHECGVTIHPEFLTQPVRPRVDGKLKLSILTPTYQRPEELARLIKAVDEQTYRPLEHVIVGDGPESIAHPVIALKASTEVRHPMYHTGHRFAPLDRDKGGSPLLAAALLATGDIYAFVPDDDILLPHYAEDVIRAFEDGCDVYESRCHVIDTKMGGQSEMNDICAWRWELTHWQSTSFDFEKGDVQRVWQEANAKFAYGSDFTVIRSVEPSDKPEMTGSVR